MLHCEGIKGSKKGITVKMLGQISNLPMGLQSTLSLMMILKIRMIQGDLNMVGKVNKLRDYFCSVLFFFAFQFLDPFPIGLTV